MIGYPTKKTNVLQTSAAEALKVDARLSHMGRGMTLESDINASNDYYIEIDRALIHKKPTPIQVVRVDYPKRSSAKIVEAYYKTPSTTDYNGIYRGKAIDFEAKETKVKTFPFANISKHQIDHLQRIIDHGGIAFVIIAFTSLNEVYLIDASYIIDDYYHGERKSMTYDKIKSLGHIIPQGYQPRLDYLKVIDEVYIKEDK